MKRARNPVSLSGILKGIPRGFDAKPIWAQINVTWRCNLTCHYCTEYDNSKGHVRRPRYTPASTAARNWG